MKKCVRCGKEILDKTQICPYCSKNQELIPDEKRETENNKSAIEEEKPEKTVIISKGSFRKKEAEQEKEKVQDSKSEQVKKPANEISEENKQNETNEQKKYCPRCGNEVNLMSCYCPRCGQALTEKVKNDDSSQNQVINAEEKINNIKDVGEKLKQNPKGILKIYCLIMALSYGSLALHDVQYITSYYNNTIWGLLMVLAGAWNAFIFAVIGLRCRKEYGKNLIYGLFAGSVFKSILHVYNIYECSKYYVNASSDVYSIVGIIIAVSICYYLMKKNGFIVSREGDTVIQVLKEIPWVLSQILNGENSNKERPQKKQKEEKTVADISLPKGKLQALLLTKTFLAFVIVYTVNVAVNVFSDFSIFKIVFQILPILFCVGIWLIYCERYKETMSTTGFTMINVVLLFELVLRVAILIIVVIVALSMASDSVFALLFFGTVILGFDIGYWRSLSKTISSMKECAVHGTGYTEMHASMYPIIIWILQTIIKTIGFLVACYLQNLANNMNSTLNQYGEEANSIVGYLTDSLGLGYSFGYGTSSDIVNSLLNPVTTWIQNTFGFSENPYIMLLTIIILVSNILLFFKIRSYQE